MEADIDDNIKVNLRSQNSFLFSIESYESKRIFDIHEQLKYQKTNISISIEYLRLYCIIVVIILEIIIIVVIILEIIIIVVIILEILEWIKWI